MTLDEAKKILKDSIDDNGNLSSFDLYNYIDWFQGNKWIHLSGDKFTPHLLEAIAVYMREGKDDIAR